MIFWIKKLFVTFTPLMLLVAVLIASFRMVQSENQVAEEAVTPATRVATNSVVIEAKSTSSVPAPVDRLGETAQAAIRVQPQSFSAGNRIAGRDTADENKRNEVWQEIDDAISGLNELVGVEMFLDVKRGSKGQMEVVLDNTFWKRVRYQTRVDLKTDISNLWHLYVTGYGYADGSVVYFIDETDGSVIDIFSRAN